MTNMGYAYAGGTVHMVCRSEERALAAKQEIIEASGNEVSGGSPSLRKLTFLYYCSA